MSEPALQWQGVSVRYRGSGVAVTGVDLAIEPGEFVAMVGPNGAGKTSLLRAAVGLVPREGQIVVHGHAPYDVAYVPQRRDVEHDFPITVEQVVMQGRRRFQRMGRRRRSDDARVIRWAIDVVELAGLERRPLAALSGGQLQRVMIARALAQEASVMLLDEPCSGVDADTVQSLMALFRARAAQGTALVLVTHDLPLVREQFARCVLIDGRLVADGPPSEVLGSERLERALGFAADG